MYKKKKLLFKLPIFYFAIHKTTHNLFLSAHFRTGRLLTMVTSGSAGYSGKRNISPATARIIAKLFVEKFFTNSFVQRFNFSKFLVIKRFGFYFRRNLLSFLRKRKFLYEKKNKYNLISIKHKIFFSRLLYLKKLFFLRLLFIKKRYFKKNLNRHLRFYWKFLIKYRFITLKQKHSLYLHFFRAFIKMRKFRHKLHYIKIFSFFRFSRRFFRLIRRKGKKFYFRKNFFLHSRARLYKTRKMMINYRHFPMSVFYINCYPDKTVRAALRTILANIPLFLFFVSRIPVAHNGIRGVKQPRK